MRQFFILLFSLSFVQTIQAQHVGILRQNFFSSYYDSLLNTYIDVLDSATIRLGSIQANTGVVNAVGTTQYNMGINLTGATINPYANQYIIGSGNQLVQFDLSNGQITQQVPITGPLQTFAFQNFRFNPSDTVIYGLVPQNFYSTYFDSISMTNIQVLDSSCIRFASINPLTGVYSLIGNSMLKSVYTLAGNAINPHQMLFYYSAVDTLVAIDLYTGNIYAEVPIQLPANALFENFTYSCTDTAIYGIVRQNYISSVYDSILMQYIDVIDSTTFRLAKINPNTGQVNIISANNLGLGATLNGSCFIDPDSMTYYFSNGSDLIGVSLNSGQIISQVPKTFSANNMYFDMMRSTKNCYGAQKVRLQQPNNINELPVMTKHALQLYPNPVNNIMQLKLNESLKSWQVYNLQGQLVDQGNEKSIQTSSYKSGLYFVKVVSPSGRTYTAKFTKQ